MAVPSWDLSVILEGLVTAPFEPLESASEQILTLKVAPLLALTSLKRVGDLQAFSVSETCMDFAPGLVKVTLRPRPGYIPKVLSASFRSQVVTLHYFHPPPFASSEDERLHMLCPVRALKLYVDRSKVWRNFKPLSLRVHSTRGVASSQALFRGVPLEDICVAAEWSSPHTFVKFYNLDVDTAPGSQILSVWTDRMSLSLLDQIGSVFSLACLVYRSQSVKSSRSVELPMKENVSRYSRNTLWTYLNRERDAAFAAKLLTLPTEFFSAEKSEEWMARSPV